MKNLNTYLQPTDESLRTLFTKGAAYDPHNPKHRLLYSSFITWFKSVSEKYPEDLIMDMLHGAEEDIELGQI